MTIFAILHGLRIVNLISKMISIFVAWANTSLQGYCEHCDNCEFKIDKIMHLPDNH